MLSNLLKKHKSLPVAQLTYIAFWLMAILLILLSECHILPTGYVKADAQKSYVLNMICILLTLGCSWGALRLFVFKSIKNRITNHPQQLFLWNMIRTCILGTCILLNATIYYALLCDTTPLYCLLITLTAFVFCWPQKNDWVAKKN